MEKLVSSYIFIFEVPFISLTAFETFSAPFCQALALMRALPYLVETRVRRSHFTKDRSEMPPTAPPSGLTEVQSRAGNILARVGQRAHFHEILTQNGSTSRPSMTRPQNDEHRIGTTPLIYSTLSISAPNASKLKLRVQTKVREVRKSAGVCATRNY